jgi:hypothetical protein
MGKKLRRLLLLVLFIAAFRASAADSEDERIAAARRYLGVAQMSKITDDTVTELARTVPAEQRNRFLEFMHNAIRPEVLERAAMASMVKVFTVEELNALADFFGSPVGRSAMGKFGLYMADVMPVIQQEMFRALQQMPAEER